MSRTLTDLDKHDERKRLRNLIGDMALNGATEEEITFVVAYTMHFINGVHETDKGGLIAEVIDDLEKKYSNKEDA